MPKSKQRSCGASNWCPVAPFSRQWHISASRPLKRARGPLPSETGAHWGRLTKQQQPAQGTTVYDASLSILCSAAAAATDNGAASFVAEDTLLVGQGSRPNRRRSRPVFPTAESFTQI